MLAAGTAGLRPASTARLADAREGLPIIQAATIGYDAALWRSAGKLERHRDAVEAVWRTIADHGRAEGLAAVALREHAAMAACARWIVAAALARDESRGMHMRIDRPGTDPAQQSRLLVAGLDHVWTRPERPAAQGIAA